MTDPFDTLGLVPTFDLDVAAAERVVRELSRALHPDRHANAPPSARRAALGKSIEVNDAWRTLKDPVTRALALLRRLGVDLEESKEPPADPAFLMDVITLRETLTEARRARSESDLARLTAEVETRQAAALKTLSAEFERLLGLGEPPSGGATLPLRRHVGELRYYRRFLEEAAAVADELL